MSKRLVVYTKIIIEGFQSFGNPVSFNLDRVGINLIKGLNGSGKSTIFNAILWAEFAGNMKKSVETWEENRPDSFRGVRVVLERTDGIFDYRIARHLGFKGTTAGLKGGDKLMIFKKSVDNPKFEQNHLLGDGLHKADMQLMIIEQLGMDEKTFLNSILFGQRVKSLVEAPNADKRKLFEELFSLDFVETAKDRAKQEEQDLNTTITLLVKDLNDAENVIERTSEYLDEQRTILKNFDTDKKVRVKEVQDDVDATKKELLEIPKKVVKLEADLKKYDLSKLPEFELSVTTANDALDTLNNNIRASKGRVSSGTTEIENSKNKEAKYQKELEDVEENCPYCKGPLNKSEVADVKKSIKDKILKEQEARKVLDKNLKKEEKDFKELEEQRPPAEEAKTTALQALKNFKEQNGRYYEIKGELDALDKDRIATEKRFENLAAKLQKEKDAKPPKVDIEKNELLVKEKQELIATGDVRLQTLQSKLDKVQWWIKKGFGSGGLKAFVFNAMLNQLNTYAQKYAGRLGFRVEFSIDMTKASKPFQTLVYRGDQIKDYEDFSGGQKQRVDVCLAFAMHDLISHKANINILVMDEIFEGLDNEGIEAAFDLIRQKAEEKSVYLITHSDIIDSLNCRSIWLDLDESKNSYISA